ncbi:type II toxin-antitoxin system RelE/ParE family toxin [Xanthomonas citri]|uniref:type II toxin-antitoxin system RelE/ParE family toxin n=1 Tax=Xanthomonas citri TaxID=346 RepID=UPI001C045FAC|nr:type II toxin-antitoxin system RelE/ParE family toxin [Xanthomonas citri]QWN07035.1 hypothetical protein DGN11_05865 [Xanthomonas citri pv. fuscans]
MDDQLYPDNVRVILVTWVVELHDRAQELLDGLTEAERVRITGAMLVLQQKGPTLGRPLVGLLEGSRHKNMKELRVQCVDKLFRILFAFDRNRRAILLIGGDKLAYGVEQFYIDFIPIADDLFDAHIEKTNAAATSAKKAVVKKTKGKKRP